METFHVKILQVRKRLGIKAIEAHSIEDAESNIIQLLKWYLNVEGVSEKLVYVYRGGSERRLKVCIAEYNFSIALISLK